VGLGQGAPLAKQAACLHLSGRPPKGPQVWLSTQEQAHGSHLRVGASSGDPKRRGRCVDRLFLPVLFPPLLPGLPDLGCSSGKRSLQEANPQ
jgi:hypothetical protein